jgi:hypothetical protein
MGAAAELTKESAMRRRVALLSLFLSLSLGVALAVAAPWGAKAAPATADSSSSLGVYKPTFVGSAATGCNTAGCQLLTGPVSTPSTANLTSTGSGTPSGDTPGGDPRAERMPSPVHKTDPPGDPVIPTVSCPSAACPTISGTSGGAYGVKGLNAVDSGTQSTNVLGVDIEPADQGLCAGNGYVVEDNNLGEILIFNTALNRVSSVIPLDTLMGLTGLGYSSGGDISCLYDASNGGHWFFTEFVSTNSEATGGTFNGCFAGVAHACLEGIAVTRGSSPFGPYNVYFLHADYNPSEPGYPYLLNDFAKIATTRDAFLIFYDEFPLVTPGLGGGGFNGSQEFAFTKTAMELGLPTTILGSPNPVFNVAIENLGLIPTPDGTCAGTAGGACWYQTIPAETADASQWDNSHGGTGFMLSSLDFFGNGDNRIAAFDWTGLVGLDSPGCYACGVIRFGGQLFSGVEPYYDPAAVGTQEAGPIPLGDECGAAGLSSDTTCPEGGIASNGTGFTQVSQANGQLWGAQSTEVKQNGTQTHLGAAYWVIGTNSFDHSGFFSLTSQGYVSPQGEDLEFPAMAAEGLPYQDGGNGGAIMAFTLNGTNYYPSTAFGRVSTTSDGLLGSAVNIADLGQSPQDGFTEYDGYPGPTRPRWGDYSWAIFLPNSGGRIYFATNYIQYPNCTTGFTLTLATCGGTRDGFANWGTSVNYVVP